MHFLRLLSKDCLSFDCFFVKLRLDGLRIIGLSTPIRGKGPWLSPPRCHKTLHPVSRDASPTPFMSCEVPLGCHVIDFRSWAASSLRVSPFKPSRQAPVSYHVFRNRLSVAPRNRNRNHRILECMYSILVWVGGKRKMRCVEASCDLCRCVLATGGLRSEGT